MKSLILALLSAVWASAQAPRPEPAAPLGVSVPMPPAPFLAANGRTVLAYELHITNFKSARDLSRLEVLGDSAPLASFEGNALRAILVQPGRGSAEPDPRKLGPAQTVIAFLWVPLPEGKVPDTISHRVTSAALVLQTDPVPLSPAKPIVLAPPLRGAWLAANGPSNSSEHRRAIIPIAGRARIAQRFAIDFVQFKSGDSTFSGDPKDNRSYAAYGAEVLAVADAAVAAVHDGIPENVPGENEKRAVPITLDTIAGNYVILDLGAGRYSMYAHLQPGSLRVKAGDRVARGQALALVGNTGQSDEPHLHFQVMDAPSPLAAEGLAYVFDSFELTNGRNPGKKQNALPIENMQVRFPNPQSLIPNP